MFKSIGSSLKRKQVTYQKNHSETEAIGIALDIFLSTHLNVSPQENLLRYEWGQKILKIYTQNKAFTNELIIRQNELLQFLKEHQITPLEVIVR